jgi:hypothetical protein
MPFVVGDAIADVPHDLLAQIDQADAPTSLSETVP